MNIMKRSYLVQSQLEIRNNNAKQKRYGVETTYAGRNWLKQVRRRPKV